MRDYLIRVFGGSIFLHVEYLALGVRFVAAIRPTTIDVLWFTTAAIVSTCRFLLICFRVLIQLLCSSWSLPKGERIQSLRCGNKSYYYWIQIQHTTFELHCTFKKVWKWSLGVRNEKKKLRNVNGRKKHTGQQISLDNYLFLVSLSLSSFGRSVSVPLVRLCTDLDLETLL